MADSSIQAPDLAEFRYALYCRSDRFGLSHDPQPPVALFRDKQSARIHGVTMWPSTFQVIDLHGEDSPCGNRN